MQPFCLPCRSLNIGCDGCILTKLFPPEKYREFVDFCRIFGDDIKAIKSKLEKIPPQLRQKWITLKPLPVPIPLLEPIPMPVLNDEDDNFIMPCYPCGVLNPNKEKPCLHCPLADYFHENNLEVFEILLLSHDGDLTSLRNEIVSFITKQADGDKTVQLHIDEKLAFLWQIGVALEVGCEGKDVEAKGRGIPWPFTPYFDENNDEESLDYEILLYLAYGGCFKTLLEDYEPYITSGWNVVMQLKLQEVLKSFWDGGKADGVKDVVAYGGEGAPDKGNVACGGGGALDKGKGVADAGNCRKVEKFYIRNDASTSGWKASPTSKHDEIRKAMVQQVIIAVEDIAAPTGDVGKENELAQIQAVLSLLEAACESAKARVDLLKKAKEDGL